MLLTIKVKKSQRIRIADEEDLDIGRLCKSIGIKISALKYWENHFDLTYRKVSGIRHYDKDMLKKIFLVYYLLKIALYTLDGAKIVMERLAEEGILNDVSEQVWEDMVILVGKLKLGQEYDLT